MFMMGELTFFLSIQVKQMKQRTFVHQAKYIKVLMKKFNMAELKPVSTLMSMEQMKQGTFVHQAKYTKDLMKKFNMAEFKPVSTPMSTTTALDPDENGEAVDQREYRSMIGSLLYLTVTRPNIQFAL
jgi:hypothetical protein